MALRYYANAPATTLTSAITAAATQMTVASVTGLPVTYPYTLIIDRGQAAEEVVDVTAASGTTLTVTRGVDSTTAFSHSINATVEHGISARDPREANSHVNTTTGVHGIGGTSSVVGTTDTQTLTNKTISADNNTISGIAASSFVLSNASGNVDGAAAQKAIPTGAVVGDSDTQTLTNKTLGTTNTINGFTASKFMEADGTGKLVSGSKAIPTGAVVGTTDTQTLTNKTLTAPTITDPVVTETAGWTSYTPTWTATTNPAIGNGTLVGAYKQIGKTTFFRIVMTAGSTTTFGSGAMKFGLPVAAIAGPGTAAVTATAFTASPNTVLLARSASSTEVFCYIASSNAAINATNIAWAAGTVCMIHGVYEAA